MIRLIYFLEIWSEIEVQWNCDPNKENWRKENDVNFFLKELPLCYLTYNSKMEAA